MDDRVRISRSELRRRVAQLAAGLIGPGIGKGKRVILQLPDWAEYLYSYF